jgi:hypothetical protein
MNEKRIERILKTIKNQWTNYVLEQKISKESLHTMTISWSRYRSLKTFASSCCSIDGSTVLLPSFGILLLIAFHNCSAVTSIVCLVVDDDDDDDVSDVQGLGKAEETVLALSTDEATGKCSRVRSILCFACMSFGHTSGDGITVYCPGVVATVSVAEDDGSIGGCCDS